MSTIHTYYSDVPDLPRFDETRLTLLWRQRWKSAGWEPFVLSEWHAQQHPYYEEYKAAVEKLPSCNPAKYEVSCYLRWLALAQVGGGWLADYDVIPKDTGNPTIHTGLKAKWPNPEGVEDMRYWHELTGRDMNKVIINQTPCCPCLVWCDVTNAIRLCQNFAAGSLGNRPQDGRDHFSDQYALEDLVKAETPWVIVRDIVKHYSDVGWQDAPVLHFPNAVMGPKGLTPKWKHIPILLP